MQEKKKKPKIFDNFEILMRHTCMYNVEYWEMQYICKLINILYVSASYRTVCECYEENI
jgi:hypothetical protein